MKRSCTQPFCLLFVALALICGPLLAQQLGQQLGEKVPNWVVPSAAHGSKGPMTTQADIGAGGVAFVPVDPCRIVKTTGPAGPFGGPSLTAAVPRDFALLSSPVCTGLPAAVLAYSLNITVTNTQGPGFIKVYPQGGAVPPVSTLNYNGVLPLGLAIANAAIVPAGVGSGITVLAGVSGTDLLIDINGYFVGNGSLAPLNPNEYVGWQGNTNGGVVFGWNTSASGFGVWGRSDSHIGVYGTTAASGLGHAGVWGESTDSVGTFGGSINTYGVWAQSTNLDGLAAFGGNNGGYLQGAQNGVVGISVGSVAIGNATYGLVGGSTNTYYGSAGVLGLDSAAYNPPSTILTYGVLGGSLDGFGVFGKSRYTSVVGILHNSSDDPTVYGELGSVFGTAADNATGPWGVFAGGNLGASGAKHFVEPHPADPKKVIVYSSLEGREVGTYFRGTARTEGGRAVIFVPEDFRIVTDEEGLTVQLTPIGPLTMMSVESEDLNQIVVQSSKDVTFHYLVQGVRRAFKDFEPVETGYEFMPRTAEERMPAYLTEEAKRRLIANGTYNADGTVNMATAERAGWRKIWADREKATKQAAAKTAEELLRQHPVPSQVSQVEHP